MFCDWITISQKHDNIPKTLSSGRIVSIDENGDIDWQTEKSFSHLGSYDTRILIRASYGEVTVSGNVGAFNRPDNVFGYSFDEIIIKLNVILTDHGLPIFTQGELFYRSHSKGGVIAAYSGATVSRLDLTQNYSTGSPDNAHSYLHYLAGIKPTRMATTAMGHSDTIETIAHGKTSKYRTAIIYDKAREIKQHKKSKLNEPYYKELVEFVEQNGVIRFELRLKQRFLYQQNIHYLGNLNNAVLQQIFDDSANSMVISAKVSDISSLSNSAYATYCRWKDGQMMQKTTTFYRHRSEIRQTIGIDISKPFSAIYHSQIIQNKSICVEPTNPPSGYFLPKIEGTQLCLSAS